MMTAQSLSPGYPLQALLKDLVDTPVAGEIYVNGLATHSKKTKSGDLFIAVAIGGKSRNLYINDAVKAGAIAVVVESGSLPDPYLCPVPLYRIRNLWARTGIIASRFYRHPSSAMTVIGVTGTNGKTTVSHLLAQSLTSPDKGACGLIGTLGYGTPGHLEPGPNTTPEAVTLQGLLAGMRDQNIRQVVMEVSSHGLDQQRIAGVEFDLAILTNLSRDHLDYHMSLEKYAAAKRHLFTDYEISQAVINLDDEFGRSLAGTLKAGVAGYTLNPHPEAGTKYRHPVVSGSIVAYREGKMHMEVDSPWGKTSLVSPFLGRFNAYNLLACLSALCLLGHPLSDAVSRLAACRNIPGRMEYFGGGRQPLVVIDYAHTPDALEQVLETLKAAWRGKIYCVFGCGGDRDQGKRPLMGAVADRYADFVILTSDNPRSESPDLIIKDILGGIRSDSKVTVVTDRAAAIAHALGAAGENDMVLIAGKGHEDYQEIAGRRRPFSDQQVVRRLLEGRS
jgi:UDP-N-acetylmuramoyl-L-alanyl-D-glutamate--2,6-diaminopimelate ligase